MPKTIQSEDVDLAIALFNTLSLTMRIGSNAISEEAGKLAESFTDRQDLINKVIELAGLPETPKKRWILARAYSWSRVEKRKEAITFIKIYLDNELYNDAYQNVRHSKYAPKETSVIEVERKIHVAQFYKSLGDMYAGEKMFIEALVSYQVGYALTPFFASSVYDIAEIYIKMNRLDLAKSALEEVLNSEYYQTDTSRLSLTDKIDIEGYRKVILFKLEDVNNKISRSYVYKSRVSKK